MYNCFMNYGGLNLYSKKSINNKHNKQVHLIFNIKEEIC